MWWRIVALVVVCCGLSWAGEVYHLAAGEESAVRRAQSMPPKEGAAWLASRVKDDSSVAMRHAYGVLLYRSGDLESALKELQRVVAAAPGYATAWMTYGHLQVERREWKEAARGVRRALDNGCGNRGECWLLLARCETAIGRWGRALAAAQQAAPLLEEPLPAWVLQVQILRSAGDLATAGRVAAMGLLDYPKEQLFWQAVYDAARQRGDDVAAETAVESARRLGVELKVK